MKTKRKIGLLQTAIMLLAITTAGIHVSLMLPAIDLLFTLNAIGFVGLTAALYFPVPILENYPKYVRYALLGYTLLTIILWVFIGQRDGIAYFTKGIEVLLFVGLLFERP